MTQSWLAQVLTGGETPFRVLHDWYSRTVAVMLVEAVAGHGDDTGAQSSLGELHARAAGGERVGAAQWARLLKPAMTELYRLAYPFADAYAAAYASAEVYAVAHEYPAAEVVEFGHLYADLNTNANVASFAVANAIANSQAFAAAFGEQDIAAYVAAYPVAQVNAVARACAGALGSESVAEHYRRLSDGLVDSLGRL